MKKIVLILLALVALTSVSAQQSLNDYKYIIVPKKFDFLNEADEYRLNSLTKYLFEKQNFEALMEGETLPSDYAKNNCLGLKADVIKESNLFKSKLSVQLTNCQNEVIYTSIQGESREKNYKVAYNQALRNAFKSIEKVNYSYNAKNAIKTENVAQVVEEEEQVEIEKLKEEIKVLKEEKAAIVKQPAVVKEVIKETVSDSPLPQANNNFDVLYAQKTPNGFQLVNKTPEVLYKIRETGMSNVYLVEGKNAILYKLDANWVLEYYENGKLQTKIIHIKF
ncbi:hypothetical protein [Lacinutrix sp. Bg11-31]|uniref:hypothetical protein n=1 Tax=Lacinutrix sp. Bg11-31 TaxID=2057808 RepID=UPI000C30320E|nr:hypothetical protein [Lacinutrix sp. Bg11-31]AUC82351.1 hypothetical protein CW733_09480 [Lacinutrix sp. Bg11-31]